jgi:TPR repeat protein
LARYEAAADKGNATAQANVGRCYERAVGVEENLEQV